MSFEKEGGLELRERDLEAAQGKAKAGAGGGRDVRLIAPAAPASTVGGGGGGGAVVNVLHTHAQQQPAEGQEAGDGDGSDEGDEADEAEAALEEANEESSLKDCLKRALSWVINPHVLEVALIMVGVGSDNVAIYLVIFATDKMHEVVITIVVFYILLVVNVLLAMWLMRCKSVALCFQDYAETVVPFVLIGLGCFIVYDSVLFGHNGLEDVD